MPDFSFAKHDQLIDALVNSPSVWDSHSTNASEVKKIETHGSTVLLGIRKALKLKKPVLFDHMDYSTLAKRTACLNKEFQVNQPMAADLYEGVFSISFTADGIQLFPQPMKDAESCLLMKRFADGNRLDIYIRENEIPDLLSEQLCDTIVSFHKAATAVLEQESAPNFHSVISRNFDQLHEYSPTLFSKSLIEEFRTLLNTELSQTAHILLERLNKGWVRYGHGDLHLQNICLHNGSAIPFDAIEYEDDFVIGDVVYDTSFLLMDLAARGQTKTSNQLFNRYVRMMGWQMEPSELRILRCLPFFMAMRAGIRAHVAASQYSQATTEQAKTLHAEQARFHLAASVEYLSHVQPKAIAVGGFSGSGKSTIAANLAPLISNAPGALRVRSDEIRRQLMEWDEFSPMPQSAYTPQQSEQVYTKMLEVAKTALAHGHSVILDAVFDRPHDQKLFKEQLSSTGANFQGFWLQVEKEKMQERIAARTRDASDATIDVLHMQLQKQPNTHTDWTIINADGSIEQNTNAVLNSIK